MGEYDISQWRLAGRKIHTPSDQRFAPEVRTGFNTQRLHQEEVHGRERWGPSVLVRTYSAFPGIVSIAS